MAPTKGRVAWLDVRSSLVAGAALLVVLGSAVALLVQSLPELRPEDDHLLRLPKTLGDVVAQRDVLLSYGTEHRVGRSC
jgi:hypothetical protein